MADTSGVIRSAKSSTLATTTGTVVVVQSASSSGAKSDDNTYHAASKESDSGGAHFLAVLSPTEGQAMQYLANRPPGAHVLVKDENDNLALYLKFKQAVRALVLIKAKELRKQEAQIEWGRPYRPTADSAAKTAHLAAQTHSTMMTPVHRIHLAVESYLRLEQCWKRFLPQVKAILLQMCCESCLNEDAKLDDWAAVIASAQSPFVLTLTPHSCGFYILGTPSNLSSGGSSGSISGTNGGSGSTTVAVRHVEFDFQKHVMVVADGTFNPAAFIVSTHFSSKKLLEADVTFKVLRDNFLTPDRVMMKETTAVAIPMQLSTWSHCVELNSSDPEFTLLAALQSVCWHVVPHEPLPPLLLDSLRNLHLLFETSYTAEARKSSGADWTPSIWPKEKIRMAVQIFPFLLELMVAAASGLEAIEAATSNSHEHTNKPNTTLMFPKQKLKLLHQFARVMRFDMVHMINRCDEAMLYKFAHHIFQFYLMRSDLPAEFIELIRDLLTLAPEFRVLFLKNQGANLLWKALHTGDRFHLESSMLADISPLAQAIMKANVAATPPKSPHERRTSLFGLGKKTQASRARKSVDFGTTFAIPVMSTVKPLVFMRINPSLVQLELIAKLCRGQLEISHEKVELNSVGASSCKRKKRSKLSPKMCMYELVLQLSLEFLFSSTAKTWDRDVGLLLRLENIHGSLSNEVMQQIKDAAAEAPRDEIALSLDHILVEPGDYCRLRVVIKCISDLFRLEFRRRSQVKLAIGDKKYWYLIHLFRSELREFNDYLESCAESDGDDGGGGEDGSTKNGSNNGETTDSVPNAPSSPVKRTELLAHIAMFQWIPKALLNEWVVLSLEDLLHTASILSSLLERAEVTDSTDFEHIQYGCQLLRIFQLIMTRSTDADIRSLLVQVLNRSGAQIPSLLRHLSTAELTYIDAVDRRTSYGVQAEIFAFLHAFLALDLAVSTRSHGAPSAPSAVASNPEDVEVLEQRKAVLMADILTSSSGTRHDEPSLWEYLLLSLIPKDCALPAESAARRAELRVPRLSAVSSFHERLDPPELSASKPQFFHLLESFLLLLAQVHSSLVPDRLDVHLNFEPCTASHLHYVELYTARYNSRSSRDSSKLLRRAAELHLKCLIALGSRRAFFPEITDAFARLHVLPKLLELMIHEEAAPPVSARAESAPSLKVPDAAPSHPSDGVFPLASSAPSDPVGDPGLTLAPSLSLNLNTLRRSIPHLEALPPASASAPQRQLFRHANVHALAIILVASALILEPNFELDDALCPRFAIPSEPLNRDVLWSLQQHLAAVKLRMKAYEAVMQDLEASHVLASAARVSAVRSLVRLAAPSLVDRAIYVRGTAAPHQSESHAHDARLPPPHQPADACTYVTKGAFATVYRATPMLPRPGKVAIKVLAHQKRPGDLSVLHDLYSEVAVLKRLQGEPAAVQLLDFGNHHDARNFEVMLEFCPCSLAEWRATLPAAPFRSLLVMVLRAFEHTCQALARIHREGVGHFDVKGDNVLIRTTALDLTRRLLFFEEREGYESEATRFLRTSFCFGDFGESLIAVSEFAVSGAPPPANVSAPCFFTSRTRGTEAIKSPEMLRIRGGGAEKERVTFDSDVWSLGCLLYELLTQELLFGGEDAAKLFTHLAASDARVLRDEHERKIAAALSPKDEPERLFVQRLVALCEKLLLRSAVRPALAHVLADVRRLLEDAVEFAKSSDDKRFLEHVIASEAAAVAAETVAASRDTVVIADLPSRRVRWDPSDLDEAERDAPAGAGESASATPPPAVTAARFFWNLHVGVAVDDASYYAQPLTRTSTGDRATSATTAFMDAIEAEHGDRYAHFVYFLWDNDANGRFDGGGDASASNAAAPGAGALDGDRQSADATPSLANEVSEESGRTCVFMNASWIARRRDASMSRSQAHELDTQFFRQVDLDAHQLFPICQRLLRSEPGSVLLLGVGRDAQATHVMGDVVASVLLFFLQNAFALDTSEALAFLARDCGQLFGLPSASRLLELEVYGARHEEVLRRVKAREKLAHRRFVAHCLCGESAFAVPVDAIRDAMYHQQQQCTRTAALHSQQHAPAAASCACFHPFPAPPVDDAAGGDLGNGFDPCEERLMFPLESRSRRRDQVAWAEVDARVVERLDSLFGVDLLPAGGASGGAAAAASATSRDASQHLPAQNSSGIGGGQAAAMARQAPLSSRAAAAPLLLSFRELRRRRRSRRQEDASALAGVAEDADAGGHSALTLGLKERAYGAAPQRQAAGASPPKPRKLFECELCSFPVVAVSSDGEKVAIPLFLGRKAL